MQTAFEPVAVPGPRRSRGLCLVLSLIGYVAWPALSFAAAIAMQLIEHDWEVAFLFSGLLPILLIPFQLAFGFGDSAYAVFTCVLWMLVWAVPTAVFLRRPRRLGHQWIFISVLTVLSAGQSALGLLMLIGKHV